MYCLIPANFSHNPFCLNAEGKRTIHVENDDRFHLLRRRKTHLSKSYDEDSFSVVHILFFFSLCHMLLTYAYGETDVHDSSRKHIHANGQYTVAGKPLSTNLQFHACPNPTERGENKNRIRNIQLSPKLAIFLSTSQTVIKPLRLIFQANSVVSRLLPLLPASCQPLLLAITRYPFNKNDNRPAQHTNKSSTLTNDQVVFQQLFNSSRTRP